MPNNTLKDFENKIKQLILLKDYSQAFKLSQEILRYDPNNVTIIKLQNKIEKKVKKRNSKIIEKEIQKLKPLYNAGQYEQYLKGLSALQSYLKDYPKLKILILDATNKLNQSYKTKRNDYIEQQIQTVNALIEEEKYIEALNICTQLLQFNIKINKLNHLISSIKHQYINSEFEKNHALLQTNKYEDINLFYQNLKKIDPQNNKINTLIERNKKEEHLNDLDNKKDFIYKILEEIKILNIKKKYDDALKLTMRILTIDPDNKLFQNYRSKFFNKINHEAKISIIQEIKKSFNNLSIKYKENSENFIKI